MTLDESAVNNKYDAQVGDIEEDYMNKLITEENMSETEARKWMSKVLEEIGSGVEKEYDLKTGSGQIGSFISTMKGAGKMIAGPLGDAFAEFAGGETEILENYKDAVVKSTYDRKQELKTNMAESFSQSETVQGFRLFQTKGGDGFYQILGSDNNKYPSQTHAGITQPLIDNPEGQVIHSNTPALQKDPAKYIDKVNRGEEGYGLKLQSVKGLANKQGGIDVYYDLTSPKEKENGLIKVTVNSQDQINNIIQDLITQGDRGNAQKLVDRMIIPEAMKNKGNPHAKYKLYYENMLASRTSPIAHVMATVDYKNGKYYINFGDMEPVVANTPYDVGNKLTTIQQWVLAHSREISAEAATVNEY